MRGGNPEEIQKLTQEIEDYKLKLKTEFGYTKNDIPSPTTHAIDTIEGRRKRASDVFIDRDYVSCS